MAQLDSGIVVRQAGPGDEAALVRLRELMFSDMGISTGAAGTAGAARAAGVPGPPWQAAALSWFTEYLSRTGEFAAFVADHPQHGVVAVAMGLTYSRPPGPSDPAGQIGHIYNVCTDAGHRRLGLARACVQALVGWFETRTRVSVVDLNATADGGQLYRELGFEPPRYPPLQIRFAR